ncbi:ABC transporter substrate-binding protein [Azotosporobacter soli]|uniref:ABC transporter substrate-binding protein n=1 Tax=Azotosporobacter soli TaxID=3055040 RepID=UPI0031FF0875
MRFLLLCFSLLFFCGCASQTPPTPPAPLLIGALFEQNGKYAEFGLPAIKGVEMAVAEQNAAGGIGGRPIRLLIGDTKSEEGEAVKAFAALAQNEGLLGVIGPNFSAMGIAINPLAEAHQIPFIATWATNPRVTVDDNGRTKPFAFRICFNDLFQGTVMGQFAARLPAKRAATLIDDTAYYSNALSTYFERSFFKEGGQVVFKDGYKPNGTDFTVQAETLLSRKPDVIFLPGFHPEVAKIIDEVRSRGYSGPILGADSWEEGLLRPLLKAEFLNNAYYSTHFASDEGTPAVQEFAKRFHAFAPNVEMTQSAVLAYDAACLLFDAIARSGGQRTQADLRRALETTSDLRVVSGPIRMDEQHNGKQSALIIELRNGKGHFLERVGTQP